MHPATLARRLLRLRRRAEVSQQLVADFTGISQESLSRYERAQRLPDVRTMMALADFYGVTLDELAGVQD